MNSSLLSGSSQSENGPVSHISVVHDELSMPQGSPRMRQGRFPSYEPNGRDDPIDFMDPQNLNDAQNFHTHHQHHGRHNPSSRHANQNTYNEVNEFPPPSDDDFTIIPVMNGSSLPPLSHKPVQLGQVDQWSISMVDELVQSAFSTLQLWMREREQLLMLKRLLLRRFCDVESRATAWYRAEIAQMEVWKGSLCVG